MSSRATRFWAFLGALRLWYYFRLGFVGFFGTLAWLIVPAILIAAGGRVPPLGVLGVLLLAVVVPFLPFLQMRYAVEGRISALFSRRAIRERFRRAPWAFAFSLMILLLAAIPLYLLKIEMIPREAAWLPSLVFVAVPRPGATPDRLGLRPVRPSRSPQSLVLPRPGATRHHPRRRLLRPDRLLRPVHLMGRRRDPVRAARLPAPGAVPRHVNSSGASFPGHRGRSTSRHFPLATSRPSPLGSFPG